MAGDHPAPSKEALSHPSPSPERRQTSPRARSEPGRRHRLERSGRRTSRGVSSADSSKWSPPPSADPHQMSAGCQRPGGSNSNASRDRRGPGRNHRLGTTQGRGAVRQSGEHPPSCKDKRPAGAKGQQSCALSSRRCHQAFSAEESPRPRSWEGADSEPSSLGVKEKDREGGGFQKFPPPSQMASDSLLKKRKRHHPEKTQGGESEQPHLHGSDTAKGEGGPPPELRGKLATHSETPGGEATASRELRRPAGSGPGVQRADTDEELEPPTMSFEAYLTYDQPPRKKKKRRVKLSFAALGGKGLEQKDSKTTSAGANVPSVQELPKVNAPKSGKRPLTRADGAKLGKVPAGACPVLPELWSPRVQPSYSPLPALELMSSSQLKQRVEEEEAGFTRRRMNSKMQVFSGSKWARLRTIMTLRQQCIQVLRNNLNSLFGVGGVPYSVLEPILESCTPDQLRRLEKSNCVLAQETDQLWKTHCHRHFKKERPEEHESWREMYLRLQEAGEQRLRELALKIRSAQASQPKGRQTKMIPFSSLEREGAPLQAKVRIKPAPTPQQAATLLPAVQVATAFTPPPLRSWLMTAQATPVPRCCRWSAPAGSLQSRLPQ